MFTEYLCLIIFFLQRVHTFLRNSFLSLFSSPAIKRTAHTNPFSPSKLCITYSQVTCSFVGGVNLISQRELDGRAM